MQNNNLKPTKTKSNGVSLISTNELFKAAVRADYKAIAIAERDFTPANCFGKPSLSKIRKIDEKNLYLCIENLLIKCSLSINIGKNISEWQIVELAGDLYKKYYYFSLEEFVLVLKKGRNGEYGQIYDRLDASIVMSWFEKYDTSEIRLSLVQNLRVSQAKNDKRESDEVLSLMLSHPTMKELFDKMTLTGKAEQTPKIKTPFNSKETYLEALKEWLPTASEEDIEKLKAESLLKGVKYVTKAIEEFIEIRRS